MDETQMLTPKQVAEILGVHQKTVHLWLRSGRLQGIKISYRAWRIPRTALDVFISSNTNKPTISTENTKKVTEEQQKIVENEKAINRPQSDSEISEISSQSRMKHYIRDIMGEHTADE